MTPESILAYFYDTITYERVKKGWKVPLDAESLRGMKLDFDIVNASSNRVAVEAGTKLTPRVLRDLASKGIDEHVVPLEEILGRYASEDIVDEKTGLVFLEAGDEITEEILEEMDGAGVANVPTLAIDHVNVGPYIRNTLAADKNSSREEALVDIYRVMRPGEPPILETADSLFQGCSLTPTAMTSPLSGASK